MHVLQYLRLFSGIFIVVTMNMTAQSWVTSVLPAQHALHIQPDSAITVFFDKDIDESSLNSQNIQISGQWSGPHEWQNSVYTPAERKFSINVLHPFHAGEMVTVSVTKNITNLLGDPMPAGFN